MKNFERIRGFLVEKVAWERITYHEYHKGKPSHFSGDFDRNVPLILDSSRLWDDSYLNARNEALRLEIEWLNSEEEQK